MWQSRFFHTFQSPFFAPARLLPGAASVACRTGPHEKPSRPERRSLLERPNRPRRARSNRRGCERRNREIRRPRSRKLVRMRNHGTDPGILWRSEHGGRDSPHFATRSSQSRGSSEIPTLGGLGRESVREPHSRLHCGCETPGNPRAGFGRSRAQTMSRTMGTARANATRGTMYGRFARKS